MGISGFLFTVYQRFQGQYEVNINFRSTGKIPGQICLIFVRFLHQKRLL